MHCEFSQHRLLERRWFKLTDKGLHVRYKSIMKTHEYELKYEDIGSKIVDFSGGVKGWLVAVIMLSMLTVILYIDRIYGGDVESGAELFYLSFALVSLFIYIITFKRSRYLSKSANINTIEFFSKNPTVKEFDGFISEILSSRKIYLLGRYGQLNRNISYETQYNNLKWLFENDVLNQSEYEEKITELDLLFPSNTVVKGFTFGTN